MDMYTTKKKSNFWYVLPIFLGIIGGVIVYFVLKKSDSSKAKKCLLFGVGVSIFGIILIAMVGNDKSDTSNDISSNENVEVEQITSKTYPPNTIGGIPIEPGENYLVSKYGTTKAKEGDQINLMGKLETKYLKELDDEPIRKAEQLTKADYEILDSKKEIKINKEYQSDIWSLLSLSFFNENSTKEQILADKISRLKIVTLGNSEELEYLKEDLNSAISGYERASIQSQINNLQSIIDYDKQKIIDLENHGIKSLEEHKQKELEKSINNHLERIQRLENLNSKNLDYLNTDKEILQYVSNYQGIDNKGNTLQTEVESFIKEKYGYDALTENNPFLKDNWVKTNTIFYFGTEAIDHFSMMSERYKVVRYAFFYPLQGEYKTILGFGFDTETYEIVTDDENSVKILSKLNNS